MTIVAASTRSYREAQTWLGLVLVVPTLPLVFAGVMGLRPTLALMAVPSLSQHFLITSLLRDERVPAAYLALSVTATLTLGALLIALAGRLYRREALLDKARRPARRRAREQRVQLGEFASANARASTSKRLFQ